MFNPECNALENASLEAASPTWQQCDLVKLFLIKSRSSDLIGGGDMHTVCLSSGMPFNNTLIPEI